MAFEQRLDLVSPKPQQDWMSPGQRKIVGGMARGVSSALSPGQKQLGQQMVNLLTPPPVAPTPRPQVTGGYTPNDTTRDVRLNPGMDTRVDLGGGNYIQTPQGTISPEQSSSMKTAATPSTPEALASRAESAAMADQRYADARAQRGQNVGGMQMPAQQGAISPDYSEAINQAISDVQSRGHGGSFDRALEQKHKVAAAQQLLSTVGGMQSSANQTAAQQGIAGMNNATDRQRIAAGQEEARQRTAVGMGQLASEDQYRAAQAATGQMNAQNEAQRFNNEAATKADEQKRQMLANAELAKAYEAKNTGWFGGIDPIAQAQANALRLGGLKYNDLVAPPKN